MDDFIRGGIAQALMAATNIRTRRHAMRQLQSTHPLGALAMCVVPGIVLWGIALGISSDIDESIVFCVALGLGFLTAVLFRTWKAVITTAFGMMVPLAVIGIVRGIDAVMSGNDLPSLISTVILVLYVGLLFGLMLVVPVVLGGAIGLALLRTSGHEGVSNQITRFERRRRS